MRDNQRPAKRETRGAQRKKNKKKKKLLPTDEQKVPNTKSGQTEDGQDDRLTAMTAQARNHASSGPAE